MKKAILFLLLSVFWTVLLFPKAILWDMFAKYAKSQNFEVVAQQKIDDRYKFTAKNIKIYFQNAEVVMLKKAEIKLWILYNKIDIKDAELSQNIPMFKDLKIENTKACYTILHPDKIEIEGFSKLGKFTGKIDIFKHRGYILLKSSTIKDNFLKSYFKKTKEGMRYEFTY